MAPVPARPAWHLRVLAVAALLACSGPLHAAPSPLACMTRNLPETLRARELQLETSGATGTSTLTGTVYARTGKGEVALNLQIEAPADLRGAAFLLRQHGDKEDMRLFLPALNRIRRISGAAAESNVFGSALHFSDLSALNASYGDIDVQEQGEVMVEGAPARKVQVKPADPSSTIVTTLLLDPASCLPLRMEVSEHGAVVREFASERSAIRRDQDRWYLAQGVMRDLTAKTTTTVRMKELRGFGEMPKGLFDPKLFHQAAFNKK